MISTKRFIESAFFMSGSYKMQKTGIKRHFFEHKLEKSIIIEEIWFSGENI